MSFEEFVSILSKSMSGAGGGTSSAEQEERELRDAFRVFDKHNRGYICASDLRAVLQCLGEDLSEEESEWLTIWLSLCTYARKLSRYIHAPFIEINGHHYQPS